MANTDLTFVYNNTTGVIKVDNQVIQIKDGVFVYNNKEYVLYNYTTTLIKHDKAGFGAMDTKYFDHPLVIEKQKCIESIEDLSNVSQFQLEIVYDNRKIATPAGLLKTLEKIKKDIIENINEGTINKIDDGLKQIVNVLLSQIKNYNAEDMVKSLPTITKINKQYPKETSLSTIISDLIRYMIYHNTFHDCIINNRSLSVYPDTIFLLTLISILMKSQNIVYDESVTFCNIQDLLIHNVIESAYNIIVMRLDREMFVNERNSTAKEIKMKYYRSFPVLNKNLSFGDTIYHLNNNPKFEKMIQEESVIMYPYIALYKLGDKTRVRICYDEFRRNKDIEKTCEQKIQWLHSDKFITLLQDFSVSHSNDYSRYNTDLFIDILSNFIVKPSTEEKMQIS